MKVELAAESKSFGDQSRRMRTARPTHGYEPTREDAMNACTRPPRLRCSGARPPSRPH
jgi:hypothetical protein